jgi:hypothetical protein
MGRQIAVVASPADEQSLLSYLRQSGPIQLCVRGAAAAAELWPDALPPFHHTRVQYFIWNRTFRWTPKVVRQTPEGGGLIENIWAGPVIEFDRTFMDKFRVDRGVCLGNGRIYWGQRNRHKGFPAWYERVAGWVRRNGVNLSARGPGCYCLPDALRVWRARQQGSGPGAAAGPAAGLWRSAPEGATDGRAGP